MWRIHISVCTEGLTDRLINQQRSINIICQTFGADRGWFPHFSLPLNVFYLLMRFYLLIFWLCGVSALAQTTDTLFVIVRHIQLLGNQKTNDRIILRELDIHEGDTLRKADLAERLEKDRRKVFNTNLFLSVTLSLTNQTSQKADLQVEVKVVKTIKGKWFISTKCL